MAILRFNQQSDDELTPEELSALLTSVMPEVPGYRVMKRIGKGGMSYVYLAVQESLDRQVAIKITAPDVLRDEVSKQRFEQEARTIAKLEHPCIVGIYEVGRTPQGLMYYVMPYLSKGHLGQRHLAEDEDRIIEVLRSLLSALSYAHTRGVVHRDVKAENVLFDNADRPVLADFGIALQARGSSGRITGAGMALGSAAYMAPEQARGDVVDLRADLYSVGVLAYELLTGQLPFDGKDALALAVMHANDPIPRLPAAKRRWQPLIDRAMAKDREQRYRNAEEMLAALEPLLRRRATDSRERTAAPTPAAPGPAVPPATHARVAPAVPAPPPAAPAASAMQTAAPAVGGRNRWLVWGALASVLAAVLSVGWWLWQRSTAPVDFVTAPPESPLPATVIAADDPIGALASHVGAAPEPTAGPTTDAPPAAAAPTSAEGTAFAATLGFQSTALPYDPRQPGARELAAARDQLRRGRLTAPAGDNAADALRAAHALAPGHAELRPLFDDWLGRADAQVSRLLAAGRRDEAAALWTRMGGLARDLGLGEAPVLAQLMGQREAALREALAKAVASRDAAAIAQARDTARALGIATPAWRTALQAAERSLLPAIGDTAGNGFRVVVAPSADRPGLAAMTREVTRGEFAAFVRATGHTPGRCRGGFLQRRRWDATGFAQTDRHPVTCITVADAQAYAQWRSRQEGTSYALPDAAQWAAIVAGSRADCGSARLACDRREGTDDAASGGRTTAGLQGVAGNVREWLRDGRVAGAGWRTAQADANPAGLAAGDDRGADDIGFRLVKSVSAPTLR